MKYSFKWGKDIYVEGGQGDTWDPTWGADDVLYSPANDTSGFFCDEKRNLAFVKVEGNDVNNLKGSNINLMADYGGLADKKEDNCNWKSSGALYIDGTIYLVVGRHCYGFESGDYNKRQTVRCASIIKSTDGGKTGPTYIPELKKYILVTWRHLVNGPDKPDDTEFGIYLAGHPWGDWEKYAFKRNCPEGWYCPRVLSKFQTPVENGVTVYVCVAGDYTGSFGQKDPDYYKFVLMPLTIKKSEE